MSWYSAIPFFYSLQHKYTLQSEHFECRQDCIFFFLLVLNDSRVGKALKPIYFLKSFAFEKAQLLKKDKLFYSFNFQKVGLFQKSKHHFLKKAELL